MMPAGRLDRRVTLQRPVEIQDSAGAVTLSWITDVTVWAGRRDIRAREFIAADTTIADTEAVFTIRWHSAVRVRWRLLENDRSYDITGIAEIGRREGLELRCVAVVEG